MDRNFIGRRRCLGASTAGAREWSAQTGVLTRGPLLACASMVHWCRCLAWRGFLRWVCSQRADDDNMFRRACSESMRISSPFPRATSPFRE